MVSLGVRTERLFLGGTLTTLPGVVVSHDMHVRK
jgi:hypothetical protein